MKSTRTLAWTDDALAEAVAGSRSWRAVQRKLQVGNVTRGLRRRANELGLDYSHFTGKRTWADDDLRAAVKASVTWAEVIDRIGLAEPTGPVIANCKRHVRRLGLDTSHFGYSRSETPIPATPLPFTREATSSGMSGLSIAARWFLERQYIVSVPLEPAPYDLVVESDEGLKKIQVKTTTKRTQGGRYCVRLTRCVYDPSVSSSAHGKYRTVPYNPEDVDYFFIAANGEVAYLIPYNAVCGRKALVLDTKYSAFRV